MKKRKSPKKHFGFEPIYDHLNLRYAPVWTQGKQVPTPPDMPDHLTIHGQRYRVQYWTSLFNGPNKKTPLDGVVVFSHRLIMLDSRSTFHHMREVLYHEAAHVYLHEKQQVDGRLAKITDAEIEGFCDLFGEAICDLAPNNPLPK